MTFEQKYGRFPDGLEDLETPPEDWQFENSKPIKITGRKPVEVPKLNLAAILPKEAKEMKFTELPMDKQIKIIADEYNGDATTSEMRVRLGINRRRFVELRDKAVDAGLITELRKAGRPKKGKPVEDHAQTERVPEPGITIEDFAKQAEDKLELAERLAKEAELLQQAGTIALALEELLGDGSGRVIDALYAEVSA